MWRRSRRAAASGSPSTWASDHEPDTEDISHESDLDRAGAAGALLVGCKGLEVPDLNNPGLESLQSSPTRTAVMTAATGLLIGTRGNVGSQNGYVSLLGILGRESYNFDPADPRFVTEMLIGPLDGGSPAFGGNLWNGQYADIRNANILLHATDAVTGVSTAEKEGIRGFAQTIKALDFLEVAVTRDSNGAPTAVDQSPTADPAPIATRAQVYAYVVALLDSASTHLAAGGASFPFALSSGFAGFDTPPTFLQFNRALRARVAVYTGDWAGALTALGQSFLNTGAPLSLGAYHVFGTGSGDAINALYDPTQRAIWAHPSLRADAQLQPGGQLDQRVLNKTTIIVPAKTVQGITTNLAFIRYQSATDPIPIIRNEELILLRAEANIQLGNPGTAVADLNLIRTSSGGLAAYSGAMTAPALTTELLYNRRYSLLFEGGHRWIDMRRYGLLSLLPKALPTHVRFPRFPFPINECTPRAMAPTGCGTQAGF
jgi:hypothetical protein